MYVIKDPVTGATTQGRTIDDAIANIKETAGLYPEEMPDAKESIQSTNVVVTLSVGVP